VDGEDVGVVLLIAGDDQADDLDLVPEPIRKQRTDGPIDEARGQGLLLDRSAFPLEISAGDPAPGIRPLPVLDGEGEEVLRLLGDLAGLEREAKTVDVDFDSVTHTNVCPCASAALRRTLCGGRGVAGPGWAKAGWRGAVTCEYRACR